MSDTTSGSSEGRKAYKKFIAVPFSTLFGDNNERTISNILNFILV
jgi:hypothetical protein